MKVEPEQTSLFYDALADLCGWADTDTPSIKAASYPGPSKNFSGKVRNIHAGRMSFRSLPDPWDFWDVKRIRPMSHEEIHRKGSNYDGSC